jgi:hypothetical protein
VEKQALILFLMEVPKNSGVLKAIIIIIGRESP